MPGPSPTHPSLSRRTCYLSECPHYSCHLAAVVWCVVLCKAAKDVNEISWYFFKNVCLRSRPGSPNVVCQLVSRNVEWNDDLVT